MTVKFGRGGDSVIRGGEPTPGIRGGETSVGIRGSELVTTMIFGGEPEIDGGEPPFSAPAVGGEPSE